MSRLRIIAAVALVAPLVLPPPGPAADDPPAKPASPPPIRAVAFSPDGKLLVAAYGSNVKAVLGDARERGDLGPAFGPELTGAEVRYLMSKEWARFPDDILWRRSKLGLTMPPSDRDALAAFMAAATLELRCAAR